MYAFKPVAITKVKICEAWTVDATYIYAVNIIT